MEDSNSKINGSRQSAKRLAEQIEEYEQIIASFERTNESLRTRRVNASPQIAEFCDKHLALNSRTLEAMRTGLAMVRGELKRTSG